MEVYIDEVLSMVFEPQMFDSIVIVGSVPAGGFGTMFVRWIFRVSPGRTCNVGDSKPSGVWKQYRVRPFASFEVT